MPVETPQPASTVTPSKSFLDYEYAKSRIDKMVTAWDDEIEMTKYRRSIREIEINVDLQRRQGRLKQDETCIPIRLCDTNIRREQPPKLQFIKQSSRIAVFKDPDNPAAQNDMIEYEFTRVSQYPDWETLYYKLIDGGDTHGWDSFEIEFSAENSGGFNLDHVGHENLIFSRDTEDFQANDLLIRIRELTISQLKNLVVKDGWSSEAVDSIIDSANNKKQDVDEDDETKTILKVFFKNADLGGQIFVGWYSKDASAWLKEPSPLFIGVREYKEVTPASMTIDELTGLPIEIPVVSDWVPSPEYEYPFVMYFYEESEKKKIIDRKGRVFKDEYKQEAATAIWSVFVNGAIRATNLQASPKNPISGGAPKQTSIVVEHGKVWSEPMEWLHTPYPDPMLLNSVQQLSTQNAEETNQISYAVNNREDSRKTATEVQTASQEQALISGVTVTLFSTFVRKVCIKCWKITKSLALQGKIKFLPLFDQEGQYIGNDIPTISKQWELFAAGDIDVVQRAQKLQTMMQFWPVIQQTPIATEFLIDILKYAFPAEAKKYEKILRQGQLEAQQLLMGTASLLDKLIKDPQINSMLGNYKQEIEQLAPQIQQKLTV